MLLRNRFLTGKATPRRDFEAKPRTGRRFSASFRRNYLQGTAEGQPFDRDALNTLLDLADHGIKQLIEKQRAIVGHLVA